MELSSKILVIDHLGFIGSAVIRLLQKRGYTNIITCPKNKCDFRKQNSINEFFNVEKIEYIFLTFSPYTHIFDDAKYTYDNMIMRINIAEAARISGVKKIVNVVSSSIYAKGTISPIDEMYLFSDSLKIRDDISSIMNIASTFLYQSYSMKYETKFVTAVLSDIYGPCGDSIFPKFIDDFCTTTDEIKIQGNKVVESDLLYVDDCAEALLFIMNQASIHSGCFNVGTGIPSKIDNVVSIVKGIVNFKGSVSWNEEVNNETRFRHLNVNRINKLGWVATTSIEDGLRKSIEYKLTKNI